MFCVPGVNKLLHPRTSLTPKKKKKRACIIQSLSKETRHFIFSGKISDFQQYWNSAVDDEDHKLYSLCFMDFSSRLLLYHMPPSFSTSVPVPSHDDIIKDLKHCSSSDLSFTNQTTNTGIDLRHGIGVGFL